MNRRVRLVSSAVLACLATTALSGCNGAPSDRADGKLKTVASFYPLEFALQQIGGGKIDVTDLTKPGVEPHDLDLSPRQVASVAEAGLTVYVKGFQKSVDEAVSSNASPRKVADMSRPADLSLTLSHTSTVGEGDGDDANDHQDDHVGGGTEHDEGDKASLDPHFWLDPVRYKAVVKAMGSALERVDPTNKSTYAANTTKLTKDLDDLDRAYRVGLAKCTKKTLVTGHAAFGYLAQRYGLKQVGVSGVSPEEEPTPQRLKDVASFAKKNGITTIYSETLVSPKTAQTVASQTGATVKVLDPLEGITSASNGRNYLEVMRSNLATLEQGQDCR